MNLLLIGDERNLPSPPPGSEPLGWHLHPARSMTELMRRIADEKFQLAVVELDFGPGSSEALLAKLHRTAPELPVVAIVDRDEKPARVRALRAAGVGGLLLRPFSFEEMRATFSRHAARSPEAVVIPAPAPPLLNSDDPAMQRLIETVERAADSLTTILIAGESGTGKTVLARAIHARSRRAAQPFVTVSCPCLNRELLESELFGHVHGAFTGAVRDTWGKVSAAEGGTLFLDEVGDLPATLQPKLLRLLQEREFERVGETKVRTADVRIIAATNRDLKSLVDAGQFREDLYYRLNVIAVELPPLRCRRADIVPLARVFLSEIARTTGRPAPELSPDAEQLLERHTWPGNLRELHNCLERAAVLHPDAVLTAAAFAECNPGALSAPIRLGDQVSLRTVAEAHIREVIAQSPTLDQAAQILGINKSTLYRKRQRMTGGVEPFPPQSLTG